MSKVRNNLLCWLGIILSGGLIIGCGGVVTTNMTTGNTPDFSVSTNVSSVALTAGGSAQTVKLSATALNGFTGTINVTISGLSSGVTASPSTFNLAPGGTQQVSLSASAAATVTSSTVKFTAMSGKLSHSASVAVTVGAVAATPDFSISANVSSLTLTAGGSAQPITLSATALNGFTGTISVTTSGLS